MSIEHEKQYLIDKLKSKFNLRTCRLESSSFNQWESIEYLKKDLFYSSLDFNEFSIDIKNTIKSDNYFNYDEDINTYISGSIVNNTVVCDSNNFYKNNSCLIDNKYLNNKIDQSFDKPYVYNKVISNKKKYCNTTYRNKNNVKRQSITDYNYSTINKSSNNLFSSSKSYIKVKKNNIYNDKSRYKHPHLGYNFDFYNPTNRVESVPKRSCKYSYVQSKFFNCSSLKGGFAKKIEKSSSQDHNISSSKKLLRVAYIPSDYHCLNETISYKQKKTGKIENLEDKEKPNFITILPQNGNKKLEIADRVNGQIYFSSHYTAVASMNASSPNAIRKKKGFNNSMNFDLTKNIFNDSSNVILNSNYDKMKNCDLVNNQSNNNINPLNNNNKLLNNCNIPNSNIIKNVKTINKSSKCSNKYNKLIYSNLNKNKTNISPNNEKKSSVKKLDNGKINNNNNNNNNNKITNINTLDFSNVKNEPNHIEGLYLNTSRKNQQDIPYYDNNFFKSNVSSKIIENNDLKIDINKENLLNKSKNNINYDNLPINLKEDKKDNSNKINNVTNKIAKENIINELLGIDNINKNSNLIEKDVFLYNKFISEKSSNNNTNNIDNLLNEKKQKLNDVNIYKETNKEANFYKTKKHENEVENVINVSEKEHQQCNINNKIYNNVNLITQKEQINNTKEDSMLLEIKIQKDLEQEKIDFENMIKVKKDIEINKKEQEKVLNEKKEVENIKKIIYEKEQQERQRIENERIIKEEQNKQKTEQQERIKKMREEQENQRIEQERIKKEQERIKKEHEDLKEKEKQRIENERIENERIEQERIKKMREEQEKQRIENERIEQERIKKMREEQENQRIEQERIKKEQEDLEKQEEQERIKKEKLKKIREDSERLENKRLQREREEQENMYNEKLEKQKQEKLRLKKLMEESERLERERIEREKHEEEQERLEQEQLERERLEEEKKQEEKLEQLRKDRDRLKKLREESEKKEQERLEKEKEKLEKSFNSENSKTSINNYIDDNNKTNNLISDIKNNNENNESYIQLDNNDVFKIETKEYNNELTSNSNIISHRDKTINKESIQDLKDKYNKYLEVRT